MFKKLKNLATQIFSIKFYAQEISADNKVILYNSLLSTITKTHPDSIVLKGYKVFSQVDEDGIIDHIFREIKTVNKTFVEIGCGNGLENNTHYLLLKGWKGLWVDGSEAKINFIKEGLSPNYKKSLCIKKSYVEFFKHK